MITEGGEVVSLTLRQRFTARKIPADNGIYTTLIFPSRLYEIFTVTTGIIF
jgi:hypothetical protein